VDKLPFATLVGVAAPPFENFVAYIAVYPVGGIVFAGSNWPEAQRLMITGQH
jgi:hypothetical protein